MKDVANQLQSPQGNDYNSLLSALSKPPLPTDFEQTVLQRTILADLPKAVPPDSFEQNILQAIKSNTPSKLIKWLFAGVGSIALVGITWFALSNSTEQGTSQPQKLAGTPIQSTDNAKKKESSENVSIESQSTQEKTQTNNEQVTLKTETTVKMVSASSKLKSVIEKQRKDDEAVKLVTKKVSKSQSTGIKDKQVGTIKHPNKSDVDKGGKIPQKLLDEE